LRRILDLLRLLKEAERCYNDDSSQLLDVFSTVGGFGDRTSYYIDLCDCVGLYVNPKLNSICDCELSVTYSPSLYFYFFSIVGTLGECDSS
jgi:hypothetical protein